MDKKKEVVVGPATPGDFSYRAAGNGVVIKNDTTLWNHYHRIQRAAVIKLPCREKHEHTPKCHVFGFHEFHRAFATMNTSRLSADSLPALMWHKDYATTRRYINMARRLDDAVESLHVPTLLKGSCG